MVRSQHALGRPLIPIVSNLLDDLERIFCEEEPHLLLVALMLPGTTCFEP